MNTLIILISPDVIAEDIPAQDKPAQPPMANIETEVDK